MSGSVTLIIRSAGERTLEACRALVGEQVHPDSITVVNERPFEKTLRRTYEIGIERDAKWTMTLDADVLLWKDAVRAMLDKAESMPHNYLQLEGRIYDKFTLRYRSAGHRIYRTSLLAEAQKLIPPSGTELRPEDTVVRKMAALGHPSCHAGIIVGIHDYEQYYRDIYRKSFVHANKHLNFISEMVPAWKKLAKDDFDYLVALKGLCDGLLSRDFAKIDVDAYPRDLKMILEDFDLVEKSMLNHAKVVDGSYIRNIFQSAGAAPLMQDVGYPSNSPNLESRLAGYYGQLGIIRIVPFLIGRLFSRMGNMLSRAAFHSLPSRGE